MAYALRPDVFWCIANKRVVLLDVIADRYMALPIDADAEFQAWAQGDFKANPRGLDTLVAAGMIIPSANAGSSQATTFSTPSTSRYPPQTERADLAGLTEAWLVQLQTRRALKRMPLSSIIADLRQGKANPTKAKSSTEIGRRGRAIDTYLRSARAISTQDQCLRWSISMVRFLRRRHYYPNLVLGVRMMPFSAHAWVQDGDVVLSDTVEQVSAYTPILVV
jgi:hypothetical protein